MVNDLILTVEEWLESWDGLFVAVWFSSRGADLLPYIYPFNLAPRYLPILLTLTHTLNTVQVPRRHLGARVHQPSEKMAENRFVTPSKLTMSDDFVDATFLYEPCLRARME